MCGSYQICLPRRQTFHRYKDEEEEETEYGKGLGGARLHSIRGQRVRSGDMLLASWDKGGAGGGGEGKRPTHNHSVIPGEDGKLIEASHQIPPGSDVASYEDS